MPDQLLRRLYAGHLRQLHEMLLSNSHTLGRTQARTKLFRRKGFSQEIISARVQRFDKFTYIGRTGHNDYVDGKFRIGDDYNLVLLDFID